MSKKLFMKPLKALASPGIYLFGKYNQYKRERLQSNSPPTPAENELSQLNIKIDKLLNKLNGKYVEVASTPEEECVICVNAKAVMQTYPCGHKVVCRRCFVKTIQIALAQRSLPLRCVICRAKILRLKHTHNCKLSSIPPFQCRSSFRRTLKRSPDIVTSSCSLEGKSWSSVTKHSRSLPGINRSSLKYKSTVDRSHSAVVYRQSVNSIRKNYRSCSLSSCSSDKCHNTKFPAKEYRQNNFQRNCNTSKVNESNVTTAQKIPRNEKSTPVSVSRETLIRQFQRDFKEGQLSDRLTSERNKSLKSSFATPKRNSVVKDLKNSQSVENKHSNADHKRIVENTTIQSNQKYVDKVPSKIKEKYNKKTQKLAKSEKKDKNKVENGKNTKNSRSKEKKVDKKLVKVK